MKLILLGPPGAGKGTQAEILCKKLNIPTISTGNILRAAVKNGTPVGLKAKEYMDAGKLVPDEVIIGVISERLAEADCQKGFILDGVPRTIPQAEALEKAGITFDAVVSLEISDDEIVDRMGGRRVCASCGAPYHVKNLPPKVEGVCDACGRCWFHLRREWINLSNRHRGDCIIVTIAYSFYRYRGNCRSCFMQCFDIFEGKDIVRHPQNILETGIT